MIPFCIHYPLFYDAMLCSISTASPVLQCASEHYNNSFQLDTHRIPNSPFQNTEKCKFFITLQKIPWQTFKQTVLCSQRKMQWPKQVHVRKLYRERESPAESSCRRLVRWNAFGSRAAEHIVGCHGSPPLWALRCSASLRCLQIRVEPRAAVSV